MKFFKILIHKLLALCVDTFFAQDVYGSLGNSSLVESLILNIVCKISANYLYSIPIGWCKIPLPPMNIDPSTYAIWFPEKFLSSLESNKDAEKSRLCKGCIERKNLER